MTTVIRSGTLGSYSDSLVSNWGVNAGTTILIFNDTTLSIGLSYSTSLSGFTWTSYNLSSIGFSATPQIYEIKYNGSYYIACDSANGIYKSSNGTSWSLVTSAITPIACAWNGSYWLAVDSTSSRMSTSSNGTTWSTPYTATNFSLSTTMAGNNLVRWISKYNTWICGNANNIAVSSNAINWTKITVDPTNAGDDGWAIGWDGTTCIVGMVGNGNNAYSTDLSTWSSSLTGNTNFRSIASNGSMWVMVHNPTGASTTHLVYSTDGINWITLAGNTTLSVTSGNKPVSFVKWNGSFWIAGYSYKYFTSTDGINWSQYTSSGLLSISSSNPIGCCMNIVEY